MAKINTHLTRHGNKTETFSDGTFAQYNAFPNGTIPEKKRLKRIIEAYDIINRLDKKIDLYGPCNTYFKSLPKGKSFSHFWRDNTIFINYSPSLQAGYYGETHTNDKDICITAWCLNTCNRWMVAATIVHEFAHIAGAPGGSSHAAEKAVDKCGFTPQYDPTILGSIIDFSRYIQRMA